VEKQPKNFILPAGSTIVFWFLPSWSLKNAGESFQIREQGSWQWPYLYRRRVYSQHMRKLSIVAYLDGRPGHDKQTRAVVHALEGMTAVEVRFVLMSPEPWLRRLISWVRYCCGPVPRQTIEEGIDLAIGAGRRTHLPLLRHKKNSPRTRVVACMAPDRMLIDRFDLCLVPYHDKTGAAENIVKTAGPPCLSSNRRGHGLEKGLILIGGIDAKSHYWDSEKIIEQVKKIMDRDDGREWTLSSSRRTPEATIEQLARVVAGRMGAVFFRAEDTPPGWIEEQYDRNHTVWVTADSVSMIYEALAAGCRVGVLPVAWKKKNNKFERGLALLRERNLVLFFDEWLGGAVFSAEESELDEASRCAREILERWWPERLQ
jgi:uncharacterized protein